MGLYTSNDAVLLCVFSTSLKETALSWFTWLPLLYWLLWNFSRKSWNSIYNEPTAPYSLTRICQHLTREWRIVMALHGKVQKTLVEYSKSQPRGSPPSHGDNLKLRSFANSLCKKLTLTLMRWEGDHKVYAAWRTMQILESGLSREA